MKFFDLGLVVFRFPDLVGKHARQPINGLPFPCRHLCWMNLVLGCNLLRCAISTKRLKRYRGLKLV